MHDAAHNLLYSHPHMVADLLRGFLSDGAWPGFDFATLEPLPASHVGRRLQRREGDKMWRLRAHAAPDGGWVYVLVLMEFQSRVDRSMALRVLTYTGLAWEGLLRWREGSGGEEPPGAPLPPVIPFVVYNGHPRWTASPDVSELIVPTAGELAWLRWSWEEDYGVFAGGGKALRRELDRMENAGEVVAMGSLAAERWKERNRKREAQISARAMERGRTQGRAEGRTEGLEFERRLLERQAARRFGADAGERLSALLACVSDPQRLAAMGDAIIDCGTGAELLAAAERIVGATN